MKNDTKGSAYDFFFSLKYEDTNNDVWGLNRANKTAKGLYVDYFEP